MLDFARRNPIPTSPADLYGRDLITTLEWSREELDAVLRRAHELKRRHREGLVEPTLARRTALMLFYNTSTRTRASFETAMTLLGGHAQFVLSNSTRLMDGESVKDTAGVYSRYADVLAIRTDVEATDYFYPKANRTLRDYADHASVPVINLGCDMYHPCQGLADLMTLQERMADLRGKTFVLMWAYSPFHRDPSSAQEDLLVMSRFGMNVRIARPGGFDLDNDLMQTAKQNAKQCGCTVEVIGDPAEALAGAHFVMPRNWVSIDHVRQPKSAEAAQGHDEMHRKNMSWRLDRSLLGAMAPGALVTHVLPVSRGAEATDEVLDCPQSVIYDQAENKLYVQMAVLEFLLRKDSRV